MIPQTRKMCKSKNMICEKNCDCSEVIISDDSAQFYVDNEKDKFKSKIISGVQESGKQKRRRERKNIRKMNSNFKFNHGKSN